jgi:hypothetical protein
MNKTTFTYDTSTNIGRIRRSIPGEKSASTYQLTDEEIQSYLNDWEAWQLAAAEALDDIAADQAFVLKITNNSAIGLSVNGVAVAQELRNRAARLRDSYEVGGSFAVAETDWEPLA